ncbi:putative bifunctional diguanylate cyclase/phosphodiesterase [Oricola cellulosilytica]|uniref:GGDEF and EAL domain-containing protein n=1 Tax=Oricola cellulosilytica TaxID=1429082 RepID=A0A4R0PEU7_9HYPH|nr:EAL domain-containing protein [Oricola cellulosilytica]TCD15303.1 GGDEF and EAL domain-containing protein [Oricola cellulosilytica]
MNFFDRWLLALESAYYRGLDVDGDLAGHLRAMQLGRLVAISPLLMMANIANGAIVGFALLIAGGGISILAWLLAVLGYAVTGLRTAEARRRRSQPYSVSIRAVRRLLVNCGILATLWGVLPCLVFAQFDGFPAVLTTMVVTGMLGGGAIALGFVPIAATVYTVVVLMFSGVAILLLGTGEALVLAPLLFIYGVVLIRSANSNGRGFVQAVISEKRVRDQAATIDILLKEYEHGGRDWIWETDGNGAIVRGVEEVASACGLSSATVLEAMAVDDLTREGPRQIVTHGQRDLAVLTQSRQLIRNHLVGLGLESGERFWFRMNGKPLYDNDGTFSGYRGVMSNVTEETKSEQRVHFLAHHDPMTGLVNRSSFREHLEEAIGDDLEGLRSYAVLYLDLDGFKAVNDMYGHTAGDRVLEEAAERIRTMIGVDDTAARLGGDEFAVLTPFEHDLRPVEDFARRLIKCIAQPYESGAGICTIGVSVGMAIVGLHGSTPAELIRAADMALYKAKEAGKGTYLLYDTDMDAHKRDEIQFEEELRQAIARGQLSLAFQPFFSADDGALAGFEALARWKHPDLGNVSPSRFIPAAEKIGVIGDLGTWVLNEASSVAAEWPDHLSVAVNVSMPQFRDGRIVSSVRDALAMSGLPGNRLEVEITEQVFADRPQEIVLYMEEIKSMGVSISLDDFGTGYSSLLYLLKFPFDKLKIDRSFVTTALENEAARGVFETIAALGGRLGLTTTAEGVETGEQLELVQAVGCTYCQGFLLGRPMPVLELAPFILNQSACGAENGAESMRA